MLKLATQLAQIHKKYFINNYNLLKSRLSLQNYLYKITIILKLLPPILITPLY